MSWLFNWIKKAGAKSLIKELDYLEPIIATKLLEAQKKFGEIPPQQFAKELIDEIQRRLCSSFGVDPTEIGMGDK